MLLGFEFENWKSFKSKNTFSMYASKERQHGERLAFIPKFNTRISPVSLIFGGNASGKSCFISAIKFVQEFILFGETALSSYTPYLLSEKTASGPSYFSLQILINDLIYEYSFSVNGKKVISEGLSESNSRSTYILYTRNIDKIIVDPEKRLTENDRQRLSFIAEGTRTNRLFLTNTVDQQMNTWNFIYDWFKKNLLIINPNTSINPSSFVDEPDLIKICAEELTNLDTGISGLKTENVDLLSLNIPSKLFEFISKKIDEKTKFQIPNINGNSVIIEMKDGKITATRIVSVHETEENDKITFDMTEESDGTQRMLELIPALSMLTAEKSNKIVIIDELDRSLHSKMSIHMLNKFISSRTPEKRAQLIFTTHDMMLMDQKIFRRDEIWLVEKNNFNESELICMSDFEDIRYDKDIRKSYLEGRMGGIPVLKNNSLI